MKRAYSLLELMAVVALIALFVGIGTVNMQGITDEGQLQTAADQIATAYRLALVESTRSGRPLQLAMTQNRCVIRKPAYSEGIWHWGTGAQFALPDKVIVTKVESTELSPREPMRQIGIAPNLWTQQIEVELKTAGGARMTARIDANGAALSATQKD